MNTFTLKMIAIICMVIDHVGFLFFPNEIIFRKIGRIAFPIFCFLIVEGFHHTKSQLSYLGRLLLFAILSEIPFDLAFYGTMADFQHQNVFITLALGLLSIFCLEERNIKPIYTLPLILIWVIAYFCHCDYGLGGVLLICVFYFTRETPWVRLFLCGLLLYLFFGQLELYALIAMVPITLYNGKKGPSVQLFFYFFYPLHLLVLYALKYYVF